jgi:mono/diheme cytochrome c family protein
VIVAAHSTQRAVALVVLVLALVAWAVYIFLENRRSTTDIVQSFLNAPNRKPAPDDEVFEGPRLDRWLGWALVSMTVVALSLPLYWLREPSRQTGAIFGFDKRSVHRGEQAFGPLHNGFNCAKCHGANGGGGNASWLVAQYDADNKPLIDPATGKQVLKSVSWTAPRINNVALRYRPDQIRNVLVYGRGKAKNNPMPAWGTKGGGPGNDQQIDDLVNYLKFRSIEDNPIARKAYTDNWAKTHDAVKAYNAAFVAAQQDSLESNTKLFEASKTDAAAVVAGEAKTLAGAQKALDDAKAADKPTAVAKATADLELAKKGIADAKALLKKSDGEILFNQNCARCHTNGYSYGEPKEQAGGFYGPPLRKESLARQFPDKTSQIDFITNGVADSEAYGTGGVNHWTGGGMPYFGNILTAKQIEAIVDYERGL